MTFEDDLSNMSVSEAKLWLYLHMDSMRAEIQADDDGRPGLHSLHEAQGSCSNCEGVQLATGIAGARGYPGMRDN